MTRNMSDVSSANNNIYQTKLYHITDMKQHNLVVNLAVGYHKPLIIKPSTFVAAEGPGTYTITSFTF